MNKNFEALQPKEVWRHFKNIMAIPHPSRYETEIKSYITAVAERSGAESLEDEAGNVIIRKAATQGMESRKGVVLQGHIDMVPQSNNDKPFDFLTESIEGYIDGEWVRANGTTLGADNGLGVAAALAILEDQDVAHGDLEMLFTVNEEMGMDGAFGLQPGTLRGDILLNLDTEVEGELCIGCAGGLSLSVSFDHDRTPAPTSGYVAQRLTISGLRGGHSGIQINEQRGNANKLLFRLLRLSKLDLQIAQISGGTLSNAIPREAYVDLLINIDDLQHFEQQIARYTEMIRSEYAAIESNIEVELTEIEYPESIIEEAAAACIVWSIAAAHDGVYRYSYTIPNLVETSSNLAIVRSSESSTVVEFLIRSFTEGGKVELADTIASTFELADAEVSCGDGYPGWQPNAHSEILGVTASAYRTLFNTEPLVKAVHAGLECGIIASSHPDLDMISFGPTIVSPHSPAEALEISSVERFYSLLKETLRNTPNRA